MPFDTPTRSQWPPKGLSAVLPQSRSGPSSVEASGPSGAGLALEGGGNLAAILAKLSADPATQTTLAAVLAKIIAAPATEATAAAILAKIIAAPATEAKQDLILTALAGLQTALDTANGHLATIATNTTPP